MNNEFGLLYVATGSDFYEECTRSAQSAKKVMPDVPITLWTDILSETDRHFFDSVRRIENPTHSFFDKIPPLLQTPFKKTLFVDTDTYFTDSVYEISSLLDRFEIAYAHAPWRIPPWEHHFIEEIPICFPEPNTGVIAYQKNEKVLRVISQWEEIYASQLKGNNTPRHDQPALRMAMYFSDVNAIVLPPEYNTRTPFPIFKGGGCPAKILHGRDPSLSAAIKEINNDNGIQIFDFTKKKVENQPANKVISESSPKKGVQANNCSSVAERILKLEKQLQEKDDLIRGIYRSKTWRTGNNLAKPYRKLINLFRK